MHSDAFDRYHHQNSALHRLDPRIKVVVTIAFILSNALLPDGAWLAFVLAWLFLILANALSELGLGIHLTVIYCSAICMVAYRFYHSAAIFQFHLMWDFTITDADCCDRQHSFRSWLSVQMAILLRRSRFQTWSTPSRLRATILTTIIAFYRYSLC
jgi:cobalt/nickel transport system permease protein